jgi:dethiobiotin synthetase
MPAMPAINGLFITGTDTGVGKTTIAAQISRQLFAQGVKVGVYKPAASGCEMVNGGLQSEDAVALWEAAGKPGTLSEVCPQLFAAPLAPHLAAMEEGKTLDTKLLRSGLQVWQNRSEFIIVEGAGGLMAPLGNDELVIDLAAEFGLPLVIVAGNRLGCINHTLLTIAAAKSRGLRIAGVILNEVDQNPHDVSRKSNTEEIGQRVPLVANVSFGGELPEINWLVHHIPQSLAE